MRAARALLAALSLAGGAQAQGGAMTSEQLVRTHAITFQVGWTDIRPDAYSDAALAAAVQRDDAHAPAGLPPELDAERLDPARVAAFVAGLARLSPAALALVDHRTVRLDLPALRLHAWSPTTAAQLAHGFDLAGGGNEANPHLANVHLVAPIDAAASAARLAAARRFAEDERHGPAARRSAAVIWLALADTLAAAQPAAAPWHAQAAAAEHLLDRLDVAPSGGMPGD